MSGSRFRRFSTLLTISALIPASIAPAVAGAEAQSISPATSGYQPSDSDERGLWLEMEEAERELRNSNFVVRDPTLNAYVQGVLCRTVGQDKCGAARIYIVRTPQFNASMAPNGMMQLWTGLLLRIRSEAQLGAVLGHEFGHFERQHSLRVFRDMRAKTDAMAWLSFLPYGVGLLAQVGVLGSIFGFSREMERDADGASIAYMGGAGYAPGQASLIWRQFRDEADATAVERKQKSRKDKNGGFFASHPNSAERVQYLSDMAGKLPNASDETGELSYREAMAAWWAPLIDDQIKLNDFGATEFLLGTLAGGNWTSELLYARGELYRARGKDGDFAAAADFYRQSIAQGSMLPEARRSLGLALLRLGQMDEGRRMLREYISLKPDAGDRAMIVMMAGGE